MKDYFDLLALAREGAIDASVLGKAIAAHANSAISDGRRGRRSRRFRGSAHQDGAKRVT
jgi:hypothetical protein